MSIPKALYPQTCKALADKHDVEADDLQDVLAAYLKLEEDEYQERLSLLKEMSLEAARLRKDKAIAAAAPVVKYLAELLATAQAQEKELLKAKAAAEAKENVTLKKPQAKAPEGQEEQEEEDQEGEYGTKLLTAFLKLKSAKDLSFQFLVCDAKPFCALAVAKRITPKHKEELTKLTECKRFLPIGFCRFENGKYVFTLENPVTGLAKRIQDSIKSFTGKKLPIMVGVESVDAEEDKPQLTPAAGGASAKAVPLTPERLQKLGKAPEVWQQTRQILMRNVDQLKAAVRKQFEQEGPDLITEIEQGMKKLDGIFETLDAKLADSLAQAHAAKDAAAQAAELKNSKAILAKYINYVKSDPIIAHIDANPFGIKTNLRQTLTASLTSVAQTLG